MKFINCRPLLIFAISLLLGVLCSYFIIDKPVYVIVALLALAIIIITACLYKFKRLRSAIFYISIIALCFFALGFSLTEARKNQINDYKITSGYYNFTGTVCSKSYKDKGNYTANVYKLENATLYYDYVIKGVTINLETTAVLDIGDVVKVYSYTKWEPYKNGKYINDKVLIGGVTYTASAKKTNVKVVDNDVGVFGFINGHIKKMLRTTMDEKTFPFAYALLTGYTQDTDKSIVSSYRYAGIAHLFAVSGLHIGFLYSILRFIFSKIKIKRITEAVLTIIILFFYVGVCGFRISAIRAFVMCSISVLTHAFGVKYDTLNSLALSFIAIVLINVGNVFDVGCHLSFLSVLGITTLSPPLKRVLSKLPEGLADSLSVSIAASVATFPMCMNYFGYVSIGAILVNLVAVPLFTVLYCGLFLSVVICSVLPFLSFVLTVFSNAIAFINGVLYWIDFKSFTVKFYATAVTYVGYYTSCFISSDFVNLSKKYKMITVLPLVCITFISLC